LQDSITETTKSDGSFNSFTSSNVTPGRNKRSQRITNAYFYWVTREPGSFEWFKGVMDEVAEMDHKVIFNIFYEYLIIDTIKFNLNYVMLINNIAM